MTERARRARWLRELRDGTGLVRAALARQVNAPAPLRNLTLARTYLCNAGCVMCDIWRRREEPLPEPELSLQEIDDLARARYVRSLVSLNLTGGEPFLRADLGEVIACFERHTALEYTSLVTNGYQTQKILALAEDILRKTRREIWINVSVDGIDERHDEIRGMPGARRTSDATLRGLVELRSREPRLGTGILFTLLPNNLDHLLPVFHYAQALGVQYSVNVLNDGSVYYGMTHEQARHWYRENLGEILAVFEQLFAAGHSDTFSLAMRRLFPAYLVTNSVPVVPCFSGSTSAYVDPYGNVYSCVPAAPWQQVGRLREAPFDTIWSSERARWVRSRIAAGSCKCLITCEASNALKFNAAYMAVRVLRRLGLEVPGAPYLDRRTLRPDFV